MSSVNSFMTSIPYTGKTTTSNQTITSEVKGKSSLEMDDFFKLMAAQLQNQDMTNPMDQSEFMSQLTLMSTIQAISEITNVSVIAYAASLVGKEVTIGEVGNDGKIKEVFGNVTATGVYGGEQVIFVDGKSYRLSQIMAVGKLPETEGEGDGGGIEEPDITPDSIPSTPEGSGENTEIL